MLEVVLNGEGRTPPGFCRVFECDLDGRLQLVVEARELYLACGAADTRWTRWMEKRVSQNGLLAGDVWMSECNPKAPRIAVGVDLTSDYIVRWPRGSSEADYVVKSGRCDLLTDSVNKSRPAASIEVAGVDWVLSVGFCGSGLARGRGRWLRSYLLTLSGARMVAMLERNAAGFAARRYLANVRVALLEMAWRRRDDVARARERALARPAFESLILGFRPAWQGSPVALSLGRFVSGRVCLGTWTRRSSAALWRTCSSARRSASRRPFGCSGSIPSTTTWCSPKTT